MKTKVRLIIMSHLSDIQVDSSDSMNNHRINFIKYLLIRYPNTDTEIDPDYDYAKFSHMNM